jgi:2-oxoglutarate ferredoxin oxidoreductase subunit alpha
MIYEAARIAVKYMTPVIFLSDGYLAFGAEPWKIPHADELPRIEVKFRTDPEGFMPYMRDENLARPWAVPGTPGLEHRIGGLEKENITGNVSYSPENHQLMVNLRAQKVKNIENDIPPVEIDGPQEGDLLLVGWGSSYGAITAAWENLKAKGIEISRIHLKYLNPFPKNLGEVLKRFKTVMTVEMNMGQLAKLLRAEFLIDVKTLSKVKGLPFKAIEIEKRVNEVLNNKK